MAFLTEDRRGDGLMMEASIIDNIVLAVSRRAIERLRPLAQAGGAGRSDARQMAERVRVNAKAIDRTAVRNTSPAATNRRW